MLFEQGAISQEVRCERPAAERKLVQEGKAGHYTFVDGTTEQYDAVVHETKRACTEAYNAYERMLR